MRKFKNTVFLCAALCTLSLALTACGRNTTAGSTSGNNDPSLSAGTTENNSIADDIGNAAEDVVDGVGNAVDDLVGNDGFDNYSDAHDYFLETMGNYHTDADFEVRDEKKELTDYQEGSKGYHFKLYDKNSNSDEMFGEFYVDATTGMIYKVGDNGEIEEYPTKNASNQNNTNNSNNNTTNNNSVKNNTNDTNTTNNKSNNQ